MRLCGVWFATATLGRDKDIITKHRFQDGIDQIGPVLRPASNYNDMIPEGESIKPDDEDIDTEDLSEDDEESIEDVEEK